MYLILLALWTYAIYSVECAELAQDLTSRSTRVDS